MKIIKTRRNLKKCFLCGKPVANPRFKFCPSCSIFIHRINETALTPRAKKSVFSYVRRYGFVCNYTGMTLDLNNPHSAWYCVFDHWVPGDDRKVVLTSFLINDMKTQMSAAEFWKMVEQLYNFRKFGTVIKKIKLRYWRKVHPDIESEQMFCRVTKKPCCICGRPYIVTSNREKYCRMCALIMLRLGGLHLPDATEKDVLDYIKLKDYVCYYTEMKLNITNPKSPWYVVLDHWLPGNDGKLVLTSSLLNDMKSDLTEDEFWYYIEQLYNYRKNHTAVVKRDPVYWARLTPPTELSEI